MLAAAMAMTAWAQGWPSGYGGVMLQGFYWDSYVDTQWSNLEQQADELSQYFDLIWLPQSGNCNTSYNVMGYTPVYWFDQNSSFGSEQQLRSLIATYKQKNVGMIADVVINHRGSLGEGGSWVDFPAETYKGATWQLGLADICIDDDGGATAKKYAISGAADTGDDWSGMRDLDHTSANVQANVEAYLDFLKNDMGYAGFRYDMTKGYAAKYTGIYNKVAAPTFSVGEYWDGDLSKVESWIDGTKVDGAVQSAAFDFPTRYSVRNACNNSNWQYLSTSGLAGYDAYKRYAVTFIENHDTQYRSATEQNDPIKSNIAAGNAFILSMPGTPCVFLPHWQSYKEEIKQLISARKAAGITNESKATVTASAIIGYQATVDDKLCLTLGYVSSVPAGYQQAVSGTNYKVYLSNTLETVWADKPSGSYDEGFDVTLTALTTSADARIVYTTDGSQPTASSPSVTSGTAITIAATTTLKAALLVGGSVGATVERTYTIKPFQAHDATVYVKAASWPALYLYAWANDGSNTQLNGSWPGKQVTATATVNGETWYAQGFSIPTSSYSFNIVLSQGSSANQTVDIGPISSDKYYIVSSEKSAGKYTVEDVTATYTAIRGVTADAATPLAPTRVYSLDGQLLRTLPAGTSTTEALSGLHRGIYIVGGKKFVK